MNSILVATIICPNCHAELEVHRESCPHCQTSLRVSNANSTVGGSAEEQRRVLDRPWVIAVLLLHVGFLGIPMYWKTRYSVGTRLMICLLSVAYTLFAVGVIVGVGSWLYRVFTGG
jgi:uncharacterized protein YbaR (Trm112 family)